MCLWVGYTFTKMGDMEVSPSLWPGSQVFAFGKVKLRMTTRHLSSDLEQAIPQKSGWRYTFESLGH